MSLFTYHVFSLWRSSSYRILKTKTKQTTTTTCFGRSTLQTLIFEQRYEWKSTGKEAGTWLLLTNIVIHSKYFPDSDWLKTHS